MISFELTEDQSMIREMVRGFAESEMRTRDRDSDEAEAVDDAFLAAAWALELVSSAIPEAHGGGGMPRSPLTNALVLEELGYGCAGLAVAAMAPALFVNALLDFGTDAQQAEHLPAFAAGSYHAASLALHEPRFAFDVSKLETRATRAGDGFVLTGKKSMVPMASRAEHFLVVAASDAASGRGPLGGLDAFIVPRGATGLSIGERDKTMGLRAVDMGSLELDAVELPARARLGGDAGIDAARLVSMGRVAGTALATGLSRAVLDYCIPYAKQRMAFGQPIAQKQTIAFMMSEMRIEIDSMRMLTWKAASQLDKGHDATRQSQLAQAYASREATKIADNGVQIFGGHGYIRDFPLEMWLRNAVTLTALESAAAV